MYKTPDNNIEILAPAKDFLHAKAAIDCGADAVYIGFSKFSMRYVAHNSIEEIKKTIEYAHKYWVKVYVTLNCILYSKSEVKQAKLMIHELYKLNVDGIIIQDLGILEQKLPPIPIILSTTTRCTTKKRVQFFKECGISRIVLPRELSLEEIKEISKVDGMEIETFCYGFLCTGQSGNCYLTYIENLRKTKSSEKARFVTANRGACYIKCIDEWTLYDKDMNIIREKERLLNLHFLSLHKEMHDLYLAGVTSFKIEGRTRDLKYIKNATALMSKYANDICKKEKIKRASSGKCLLSFEPNLNNAHNKGYTDYFLYGRKKEMYSKSKPVGQNVGAVYDFNKNSFKLNSDIKLNVNDKLRYLKENDIVKSIEIIDIKNDAYFINPINDDINGLELFRYIDSKTFETMENSKNYRVIPVTIKITKKKNNIYFITAIDEDQNKIQLSYPIGSKLIKSNEINSLLYEIIEDCEFVVDNVDCNFDIFINNLTQLKNKIFEKLRIKREKNRPRKKKYIEKNNYPYFEKELNYLENINNEYAKKFWERHKVNQIEDGFEISDDINNKYAFCAKYCLKYELGFCKNEENIPQENWIIEHVKSKDKFKIKFDCDECSMYFYSIDE